MSINENQRIRIGGKYFIELNKFNFRNSSIFNTLEFISLHRKKTIRNFSFSLFKDNFEETLAFFNISQIDKELFKSPISGSFGSFEFKNSLNIDIKINFIESVLNYVSSKLNPKKIEITLSPDIYDLENNSLIFLTLIKNKFNLSRIEINQFIDINNYDHESHISYGNKKRIKNCIKAGIKFHRLDQSQYIDGFKVIENNRKRRGFPLTMNWESMKEMIDKFSNKIYIFGLIHDEKIIASAFCINVSIDILYVFYWGEEVGYEKLSPIALLSKNLINFAKENNYRILDIGTSSVNSIPNNGLIKFKKNIGCISCNKFYLSKKLN